MRESDGWLLYVIVFPIHEDFQLKLVAGKDFIEKIKRLDGAFYLKGFFYKNTDANGRIRTLNEYAAVTT